MSNPTSKKRFKKMSKKELIRYASSLEKIYLSMIEGSQQASRAYAVLYGQFVAALYVNGGSVILSEDDLSGLPEDLAAIDVQVEDFGDEGARRFFLVFDQEETDDAE